jgi:hypothetical protein
MLHQSSCIYVSCFNDTTTFSLDQSKDMPYAFDNGGALFILRWFRSWLTFVDSRIDAYVFVWRDASSRERQVSKLERESSLIPAMPSSSPLSSSQQSSLYQYYTPIPTDESSSPSSSRVLQPSTQHNITLPRRSRIAIKRPLHQKDTSNSVPLPKRSKSSKLKETLQSSVPEAVPLRRRQPETLPWNLVNRGLAGQRASLSQRTSSM